MQHTHLSTSRFSSYKAACKVHGVNGCPTCTPCTTGDRIIMWSECEGVVCTRLGKRIVHGSVMAYENFARSDNMHNTFSSFDAADKKWTYYRHHKLHCTV